MCYDVRYLTRKQEKYAKRFGDGPEEVEKLKRQLKVFEDKYGPVYHTTAFDHWDLPVITSEQPKDFQFFHWGLIPHFVKDTHQYESKYNTRYLNSRFETLFEEKIYNEKFGKELDNPFYKSALERRCVVVLDGYYDWHWQGKKSYNFHVLLKSEEPMIIAGIWRKWESKSESVSKDTLSLVTTDANELCRKVHNKPRASEGPRQLAVLDEEAIEVWLDPDTPIDQLRKQVRVFPASKMKAFPVKKLFYQDGRSRIPLNDEECIREKSFPELSFGSDQEVQGKLF